MPATQLEDARWGDALIRRHVNLNTRSYDDPCFIEPLVLAGLFFPVDGGSYSITRRQLEALAACTDRMEFLVSDAEYDDAPVNPWLVVGADFDAYRGLKSEMILHTVLVQCEGDWAVYIAEDRFGLVGVRPERVAGFWRAYPEWREDAARLLRAWRDCPEFRDQLRRLVRRAAANQTRQ